MPTQPTDGTQAGYSISVRFGDEILQAGFTAIPNLVLERYAALGVTPLELAFTIHVWHYWWNERDPYPALNTIAERMATSRRQVRRYVESLKEKGFLTVRERYVEGRGQVTSEYDF